MKRVLSALIITAVALTLPAPALAKQTSRTAPNASAWHAKADRIPIGSTVTIRTNAGKRITAVLYVVDDTGITFKPKTRVAEPARRLTYDQIAEVSRREDRVNIVKAIAIGAAIGGAFCLGLLIALSGG